MPKLGCKFVFVSRISQITYCFSSAGCCWPTFCCPVLSRGRELVGVRAASRSKQRAAAAVPAPSCASGAWAAWGLPSHLQCCWMCGGIRLRVPQLKFGGGNGLSLDTTFSRHSLKLCVSVCVFLQTYVLALIKCMGFVLK